MISDYSVTFSGLSAKKSLFSSRPIWSNYPTTVQGPYFIIIFLRCRQIFQKIGIEKKRLRHFLENFDLDGNLFNCGFCLTTKKFNEILTFFTLKPSSYVIESQGIEGLLFAMPIFFHNDKTAQNFFNTAQKFFRNSSKFSLKTKLK